jgi:Pyruvate/2-oxoacid:ferredoxin oxidoreductase gamma subunit
MTTRIALDGVGGQGVRVIAGVLGALLARMGKQVTVLFDYDSSVRGSMSDAFVIFDDHPIANPVVEEADIMLKLAERTCNSEPDGDSASSAGAVTSDLAAARNTSAGNCSAT